MFPFLTNLADRIDRFTTAVGRAVAWLALVIVLLQFALVVARYVFGFGSIWLTETVIYANAALFLLASAWTLRVGGHVRVDVFYAHVSTRAKGVIDLIGALLLAAAVRRGTGLAVGALCRALLGDPRALAGDERPAAGVPAQDLHPAVRRADGAAGRIAGDQGDSRSCRG